MNPMTDITNPMSVYNSDNTTTTTATTVKQEKLTNVEGLTIVVAVVVIGSLVGALLVRWMNKV